MFFHIYNAFSNKKNVYSILANYKNTTIKTMLHLVDVNGQARLPRDKDANIDFNNIIVVCDGKIIDENYIAKNTDTFLVRVLPSSATTVILTTFLVTAVVGGVALGISSYKARLAAEEAEREMEKMKKLSKNPDLDNRPFLRGASNTLAKGNSQPYILGRQYFAPYLLSNQFYSISGDDGADQYIFIPLECGFNKQVFSSISIDDLSILKFDNPTIPQTGVFEIDNNSIFKDGKIEITQDGSLLQDDELIELNYKHVSTHVNDEIPRNCEVDNSNSELNTKEHMIFTLDSNAKNIELCISFAHGLYAYDDNNDKMQTTVTITPQYSLDGGNTWLDLNPFEHQTQERSDWVKLSNQEFEQALDNNKIIEIYHENEIYPTQSYYEYKSNNTNIKIQNNRVKSAEEYRQVEFKETVLNNTFTRLNSTKEIRSVSKTEFSFEDYQTLKQNNQNAIQIKIQSDGATDSKIKNNCYLTYYQSTCFDANKSNLDDGLVPCLTVEDTERAFCTIIGLKIKANKQNEQKLKKINVITNSLARIWNSQTRTWSEDKFVTRNPSALALEIETSNIHFASKRLDEELDLESFGEFYEYCQENNFTFDFCISQNAKKDDTLKKIYDVCNAVCYVDFYGRRAIAIDKIQENAVAVYNSQNIINISHKKTFERKSEELKITYVSSDDDKFVEETLPVKRYENGQLVETNYNSIKKEISLSGISTYEHVVKYARRLMALETLRPKTTTIEIGNEGLFYTPYSKILLQDDSLKIGLCSAVISKVTYTNNELSTITLNSNVYFEQNKQYGVIINAFNDNEEDNKTHNLCLKVSGTGLTNQLNVLTSLRQDSDVIARVGNILSFGELDENAEFTKITSAFLISSITKKENGYTIELVNYDERIYDTGPIGEYKTNFTQKPTDVSKTIPQDIVTKTEIDRLLTQVKDGTSSMGLPNTPIGVTAIARQDGIDLSCTIVDGGLKDSIKNIVYEITKSNLSLQSTITVNGIDGFYSFDRAIDEYKSSAELSYWTVRAKAINLSGKESAFSLSVNVNVSNYKTWVPIINANSIYQNGNGRTTDIALSLFNKNECYGTTRFKIRIKRISENPFYNDSQFYKPNLINDPYSSEDNYKVLNDTSFIETYSNYFTQVLPLLGQNETEPSPIDTLYIYEIIATNESGFESEPLIIQKLATATSAKDLANNIISTNKLAPGAVTFDKLDADVLSANSLAAVGMVADNAIIGKLSGNTHNKSNYWDLETGNFRLGDDNQFLSFEQRRNAQGELEYNINFSVGNFEVNSVETKLSGTQTIHDQRLDPYNQLCLTPESISLQHRDDPNNDNAWQDLTKITSSGFKGKSLLSDDKLIISNQNIQQRRQNKVDIGSPLPSTNSKVYHFDTDKLDQNGNTTLTITDAPNVIQNRILVRGDKYDNKNFVPAILEYAPYSEVGGALFGQFSIDTNINSDIYTVDFWIQYLSCENQIIFSIGNSENKISLIVQTTEPNYNDVQNNDVHYNTETSRAETQNYYQYEISDEPYFADEYNEKLSTESVYNTLAKEEFNFSFTYYINSNGFYFERHLTPYDYDEFLQDGLYKKMCVYNTVKETDSFIRHEHLNQVSEVGILDTFNEKLEDNKWYHFAIVKDYDKLNIFLNYSQYEIEIEPLMMSVSATSNVVNAIFNPTRVSFLIDELLIDDTTCINFEDFAERTLYKKPFGSLDDSQDWSILQIKDTNLFKTNIFESDFVKKAIGLITVPIGFIYTQLPNQPTPYQIWAFTTIDNWQDISEQFADAFFRVDGINAQDFENQTSAQAEQLPNVRGVVGNAHRQNDIINWHEDSAEGAFKIGGNSEQHVTGNSGDGYPHPTVQTMTLTSGQTNADGTYKTEEESCYVDGGEVRPKNWTIKIWKRIS